MIGTRLLERYELTAVLGRGGMGIVYRARDPLLHREVAVKMIPPRSLTPEAEERFQLEARIVAGMDHAAIVPIYDFGSHQGSIFFVMPLIEGATLRSLIREGGLQLGETLEVTAQAADALEYSHSRGVIHGDIKPENLMVSGEPGALRARLMDFGLARRRAELPAGGPAGGTIVYMSPEQVLGGEVDGRTDVYALGVVLYECLAGEPPFAGTTASVAYRIAHKPPRGLRARGAEVDGELERIVLACLAKEPSERLGSGEDLAAALRAYAKGLASGDVLMAALPAGDAARYPAAISPLVGRRGELRRLVDRLDAAQGGECQLALIGGEVGTGKSRLLEELEHLSRGRGLRVLRGRIADVRHALPYQGLCEMILDELRSRASPAGDAGGSSPASDALAELAPELVRHFPVFSEVEELRRASGPAPIPPAVESPEPTYLFELLARALSGLSCGEPLVLLLEHLDAGDMSVEALDYLVRRLGATPTLVAGTYRPSEIDRGHPLSRLLEGARDDSRMDSMVLGPFDRAETRQWLEWLVGSTELSGDLVEQAFEASEGNPFFCQELARSLIETGRIRRDDGGVWVLARQATRRRLAGGVLPVTIQQAVAGRVEGLPEAERRILEIAAVLGRSFGYDDLEELVTERAGLDDVLDALVRRRLLEEDNRPREDRLSFASGVIRDVLYHAVPRRRRRRLHRRHAEGLERRYADRLGRVLPRLVEHFSAAEVADKTVRYALEAAREAVAACSPQDAITAVATALELFDEDQTADRQEVLGELLTISARAHRDEGDLERALADASAALDALAGGTAHARAADAALLAAETAWQRRDGQAAERWVEVGADLARQAGDLEIQKRLLTLGATIANLRGAHARAKAYLAVVERLTAPTAEAEARLPTGGVLVTALANPVASLDPATMQTAEEFEVTACVFDTLLATDDRGSVVPALSLGADRSEGGRRFELELRPGIRFSDGSPIAARDVKASFERAARLGSDPATGGGVVPALTELEGYDAFLNDASPEIAGIEVHGESRIAFRLEQPLPIFPALLTNLKTAVVCQQADGTLSGSGPFQVRDLRDDRIRLERNAHDWRPAPARLDALSFRTDLEAPGIAAGLRRGEIDLGRDLHPQDLEEILRDPELGRGLVEATRKNVYFLLFNAGSELGRRPEIRRALTGVLRPRDLVWRTLGRFAQPAVGLIPPGVFGHDAGRRRRPPSREQCRRLLSGAPIRLRLVSHPLFQDRYASLTRALFTQWRELGVEVETRSTTMGSFRGHLDDSRGVDVVLSRWIADYDDPDNFTYELFHSRHGLLRRYYSSPEADRLLERGRREDGSQRPEIYQQFEDLLAREALLLPLFHDVDYRIATPGVRGVSLKSTPPYVGYSRIAKSPAPVVPVRRPSPVARAAVRGRVRPLSGHEIHVPISYPVESLDPAAGMLADQHEVTPSLFETLTRVDRGARVVPHLAASVTPADGGRRWCFSLRPEARFHDGRRLTARDVRYAFERLLRTPRRELHFPLLPIRGAKTLRRGESATLAGFHLRSTLDFELELKEPAAWLPALLTHPGTAILPEDCGVFGEDWRSGCNGTGPFRAVSFDRGERLVLEKNPYYWQPGTPKSDRLVFHFGVSPERAAHELKRGRLSLAAGLPPGEAEALRRDPRFAAGFQHSPRLATYFLVPVTGGGPFADPELRRRFARAVDACTLARDTLGSWVTPARGLIPPGLPGHEAREPLRPPARIADTLPDVRIRVAHIPSYAGPYAPLWERLCAGSGLALDPVEAESYEVLRRGRDGSAHLLALRWIASYPDTDGFLGSLLHSETGLLRDLCSSPEIDRLIESGRREIDPALRHATYRRLERWIARDALLIPLFHEQTYRFRQPGVQGLRFGLTTPEVRYEELYI